MKTNIFDIKTWYQSQRWNKMLNWDLNMELDWLMQRLQKSTGEWKKGPLKVLFVAELVYVYVSQAQ